MSKRLLYTGSLYQSHRLASDFWPWGQPMPETPDPLWASKRLPVVGSLCWRCPVHCEPASGICLRAACDSTSPPSELIGTCTHLSAKSFLWWSTPPPHLLPTSSTTMAPCLSCGSRPSPLLWFSTPQPVAYRFPTHGSLLLSPLGGLYTTNPSPFPGTDLWSLSLSAQPPPKHLRLWCLCRWFR